jgi:hypothetical protein
MEQERLRTFYPEDQHQVHQFLFGEESITHFEKTKLFYQFNAVRMSVVMFKETIQGKKMSTKVMKKEFKSWFDKTFDEAWLTNKELDVLPSEFKTVYNARYWPMVRKHLVDSQNFMTQDPFVIQPYQFFKITYEPSIVLLWSSDIFITSTMHTQICKKLKTKLDLERLIVLNNSSPHERIEYFRQNTGEKVKVWYKALKMVHTMNYTEVKQKMKEEHKRWIIINKEQTYVLKVMAWLKVKKMQVKSHGVFQKRQNNL